MAWMILAAALLPQDGDPEAIRRQLREILGRTEFREKMPSNFWSRLRDMLRLKEAEPEEDEVRETGGRCNFSEPGGGFSGGFMNVLFILGIAVLAAFLILIAYHAWTKRAAAKAAPPPSVAAAAADPASPSAMPDPLARDSEEWAFEADRLFKQGRIAEAIRALYLAALSHAHGRRWIDYHPSKPNWEHVRRFSGPTPARASLGSLTSVFERKWYGRKPAEEGEYHSSRDLASSILKAGGAPA